MATKRIILLALAVFGTLFPMAVLLALVIGVLYAVIAYSANAFSFLTIKVLLIAGIPIFAAIRALFSSAPEPEGTVLDREDAPALFEVIDAIRTRLKTPAVKAVLLDDDFNCAVMQRARYGILGVHENYLLLGLPLMQSMEPEQFEAILAHEFGHLSARHGVSGSRIYSVTESWEALATALRRRAGFFGAPIVWFYRRLMPFFERLSFGIRREQEIQADRLAAEITGSRTMALAGCT